MIAALYPNEDNIHLQQLPKSTCYSIFFDKNLKTPLQQLSKSTWYFSNLEKTTLHARIYPRA